MKKIGLALYCEGNSDEYFLPILLQRTSRYIIMEGGGSDINIPPVKRIEVPKSRQGDDILAAAIKAGTEGYDILFVHKDADDPGSEKVRKNHIEPGLRKVHETTKKVCKNLVPVIPIQETEAWMLADINILQDVLDTNMDAKELGLPARPALVEKISDPKHVLQEAIRKSLERKSRRRRKKIDIEILYTRIAQEVRLDFLKQVPAYKTFASELMQTLKFLNLIH
jgi:Domain of unknown function (DUF4276)